MVRPGRPMHHVHNWQIRIDNWDNQWTKNERGWSGMYADRYWECIRGGRVKHTSPSREYPNPVGLWGRSGASFTEPTERRVFLAASGYDYTAEKEF